jgi:2-polyprenyl-3-methyl-5-hydroxy-6-metoxy-1,4-benzoquinol methylase
MVDFSQFEATPDDPRVLLELSNQCATENLHDTAVLFADAGLKLHSDHITKTKLLEQISISGFYSKSQNRSTTGKEACEILATDRRNSWHTKNLARQNSTYYAKSAKDIMPSTVLQQVNYTPADDYRPMNPSITNRDDQVWMIQRTVNYTIRPDGSYDMRGDSAIRTRNILIQLDSNLAVVSAEEILPPENMPPPLYTPVVGFEDNRLFFWRGDFWCTSTVRELNADGYCEIVLAKIVRKPDGQLHYDEYQVIHPQFCGREHQKNWMPMVVGDSLYFMYSSDPARVIDINGNLASTKVTHIAADSFRGGGPLLPFNGGWLACIHESHTMPDNRRRYMHRFVWYDSVGRLALFSEAFYIHTLGIEFAAGIAQHPDTGEILVSFGLADRESWIARFSPNEIKRILQPAGRVMIDLSDVTDTLWIMTETNQALKSQEKVVRATEISKRAGIRSHEDAAKNWDNLVSILHTTMTCDPNLPVMDVAATEGSSYLQTLARFGYQNLVSINIDEPNPRTVGGVTYQAGDCTKTDFPDNHFGFISCLSVIEHGVDVEAFMQESARILQPGAYLLVSTDYWQDPVNTYGQTAFGAPVKVFTMQDIAQMIKTAARFGLEITGNVDLSCNERVVNWIGMDYTFINLLFKKSG